MPKHVEYRDLFKFNKELLDDDYNPGQALVNKTKHTDASSKGLEVSTTTKVGFPDSNDQSKLAFETKIKSDSECCGKNEIVYKNDGSLSFENKYDLSKHTGCEGLWHYHLSHFQVVPKSVAKQWHHGFWYKHSNLYCKAWLDCANKGILQGEGTWLYNGVLLGDSGKFDALNKKIVSYECGAVWEPKENVTVGLKHELSTADGKYGFGKFLLMFHNRVSSARTLGAEYTYDHVKHTSAARFGFTHRFADGTDAKVKVDQDANLNAVLKHKVSSHLTAAFTAGLNLKDFHLQQTRPHPIGVQFDFKF